MNWRNREWLDVCYIFPCHLNLPGCEGGDSSEPAHSNQAKHGKGGGMKAHDCFVVPACRSCHREFDQGKTMTKQQKADLWDSAYLVFLPKAMMALFGETSRRKVY